MILYLDGCIPELWLFLGMVNYDQPTTNVTGEDLYPVGTTATFTCNHGYSLSSSLSRTCQASGNWNGQNPTCSGIDMKRNFYWV